MSDGINDAKRAAADWDSFVKASEALAAEFDNIVDPMFGIVPEDCLTELNFILAPYKLALVRKR
jgi:hypothetical protein